MSGKLPQINIKLYTIIKYLLDCKEIAKKKNICTYLQETSYVKRVKKCQ